MALSTIGTNSVADSAITVAKTSGLGITEADQWRVTSTFSNSSNGSTEVITANWERNDSTGFGKIGTGMSQSSGVFTFSSTGVYYVTFFAPFDLSSATSSALAIIQCTTNNSDYSDVAVSPSGADANRGLSLIHI